MVRTPPAATVQKLLDFLKVCNRVEGKPGFATTALGLSHEDVSKIIRDSTTTKTSCGCPVTLQQPNKFTIRYPFRDQLVHRISRQEQGLQYDALSTHLAIIDEVTTWALVLADPIRSRAGVSVCLHASWGSAYNKISNVVELETSVTKIGNKLGFVNAKVRNDNHELICYGSQIKYLPMGFVTDFALSNKGWEITKLYADYCLREPAAYEATVDLFKSFELVDADRAMSTVFPLNDIIATFEATKHHASLGGSLHGGCHGVLMERTANAFVQRNLEDRLRLESMSIEYQSSPSRKVGLRIVEILFGCSNVSLRVQLVGLDDGRTKSEGLLRYVPNTVN